MIFCLIFKNNNFVVKLLIEIYCDKDIRFSTSSNPD